MNAAPFPDRETVAEKLRTLADQDRSFLRLLFENPVQDDNLLDGLVFWLNLSAEAKFLNSLKISQAGEWLGNEAPGRLQIRLMEIARSSHHPAFQTFREGLTRSGGLERAYPKSEL